MKNKKGFTLIELLVVVAIISLLSSIVFASLTSARDKGKDANVKANLISARTVAQLYYENNGNYGTSTSVCDIPFFAAGGIRAVSDSMFNATGTGDACVSNGTNYVYGHRLKTDPNLSWCIDSTGASRQVNTTALFALVFTSPVVCPP